MPIRDTLARWMGLEKRNYSDLVLQSILAQAGAEAATARLTAAQEAAVGLWGRAFSGARASESAMTPQVLGDIGRDLCQFGESLHLVDVIAGRLVLRRAARWEVFGGANWRYRVDVAVPSGSAVGIQRAAESVLHVRYAPDPMAPWKGCSPLAGDTAKLLGGLEAKLAAEAQSPCGYVLPVPHEQGVIEGGEDPLAALKSDLRATRGGLSLVETVAAGWGDGRSSAPMQDWVPKRFGMNPPEPLAVFRSAAERSLLFSAGIPPALLDANSATAAREAYRQFLSSTIQPVARLVEAEASAKLGADVTISFDSLMASDVVGRSRALKSLIDSGMERERAERICGFSG